jgi:hypothetical protein
MKFLTKLGALLLKGVAIVSGISPLVTTQFPGSNSAVQVISADLAQIADIIAQVEAIGQALGQKGPDKLKAAGPLVAQVVLKSALLANHKIAQPDLFAAGSTKIADGMADILNSLAADGIKTEDKKA